MIKRKIQTTRTARYFLSQELHNDITEVVFILHGYAQNADDFLKQFSPLFAKNILFVAPEGLSKFYWKDFTSNPSSSWMTSLERQDELEDFKQYMQAVETDVLQKLNKPLTFSVLGFSQGAAMASRFAANSDLPFNKIIMYAAAPAHDLAWESIKKESDWHVIYGTKDWFITPESIDEMEIIFNKKNVDFKTFTFEGKHEIHVDALGYIKTLL